LREEDAETDPSGGTVHTRGLRPVADRRPAETPGAGGARATAPRWSPAAPPRLSGALFGGSAQPALPWLLNLENSVGKLPSSFFYSLELIPMYGY